MACQNGSRYTHCSNLTSFLSWKWSVFIGNRKISFIMGIAEECWHFHIRYIRHTHTDQCPLQTKKVKIEKVSESNELLSCDLDCVEREEMPPWYKCLCKKYLPFTYQRNHKWKLVHKLFFCFNHSNKTLVRNHEARIFTWTSVSSIHSSRGNLHGAPDK